MDLIDVAVVGGLAIAVPLGLDAAVGPWLAAAFVAALGFELPAGWAAGSLVLPAAGLVVVSAVEAVRRRSRLGSVLVLWAAVSVGALMCSRLGADPAGVGEPLVELTAVHYAYAGVGALALAARARRRMPGRAADTAVGLLVLAPPVVALGFVTGAALPQVGGAVTVAVGICTTAALELAQPGRGAARLLRTVSGLAVWVPMVLAVAWAAGQHWDVPALSIPAMERLHGVPNALLFIGAGLAAARLDPTPEEP